jgi:hypothetical protein
MASMAVSLPSISTPNGSFRASPTRPFLGQTAPPLLPSPLSLFLSVKEESKE